MKLTTLAIYALLLQLISPVVNALPNLDDPTQSIKYWKQYAVSASESSKVAIAEEVFERLLRTWSNEKQFIPPKLTVVDSKTGPWAASLVDGNILISSDALDITLNDGAVENQNQLAFILAHELAHQQNEDMWHYKFLRLVGSQTPKNQSLMARGLALDINTVRDLENREAKADQDAIFIMAMVGYNPFSIVDDKNFFIDWVENVWDMTCPKSKLGEPISSACEKAKIRSVRVSARLKDVTNKTLLFDLGVQSYVAGEYSDARHFFSLFEREYSSPAVLNNIGLTYLAELTMLKSQENYKRLPLQLKLFYPFMLSARVFSPEFKTRGGYQSEKSLNEIDELIEYNTEKSIELFERAIKLSPQSNEYYSNLAISYLLQKNTFMVRGVVQGRYQKRFGDDLTSQLLLAITSALENEADEALFELMKLNKVMSSANNYIKYSISGNIALLFDLSNQFNEENSVWKSLARKSQKSGDSVLMQIAINQLKNEGIKSKLSIDKSLSKNHKLKKREKLWIDGELYTYIEYVNGESLIQDEHRKISYTWQRNNKLAIPLNGIAIGARANRLLKLAGTPNRLIPTSNGLFYAYDNPGIGFRIEREKVVGWFYY